jgi:hypothetical protein
MATTTTTTDTTATKTGASESLANWAGPYVTNMLGQGQALANAPYQAYMGPLTAGPSALQESAFSTAQGLGAQFQPSMGAFTPSSFTSQGTAQQYMNPYIQSALQPQLDELRRQTEISRADQASKLARAGAYGGSRQALADVELTRAMLDKMAGVTGKGYMDAYTQGQTQFNQEQARQQAAQDAANALGLAALAREADLGTAQRAIEQEGITADKLQFEQEYREPYKNIQFMSSLLQGLPIAAQSYQYQQPSIFQEILGGAGDFSGILGLLTGSGGTSSGDSNFLDSITSMFT